MARASAGWQRAVQPNYTFSPRRAGVARVREHGQLPAVALIVAAPLWPYPKGGGGRCRSHERSRKRRGGLAPEGVAISVAYPFVWLKPFRSRGAALPAAFFRGPESRRLPGLVAQGVPPPAAITLLDRARSIALAVAAGPLLWGGLRPWRARARASQRPGSPSDVAECRWTWDNLWPVQ